MDSREHGSMDMFAVLGAEGTGATGRRPNSDVNVALYPMQSGGHSPRRTGPERPYAGPMAFKMRRKTQAKTCMDIALAKRSCRSVTPAAFAAPMRLSGKPCKRSSSLVVSSMPRCPSAALLIQ